MPYSSRYRGQVPTQLSQDDQILTGKKTVTAGNFFQDEILMPNCPEGVLPGLLRVEIEQDINSLYLDAAGEYIECSLSGKSQDDVLLVGDADAICVIKYECIGIDITHWEPILKYDFPAPLKVSYKKLYIQFKCTKAQDINYRIHWVPRASAVPQRDNLVSQTQF